MAAAPGLLCSPRFYHNAAVTAASCTQVTKLCDLPPGDSVCSVAWSQRGTYLSVGTNTGEVQVRLQAAAAC